ncbi:MAG: amidohydrolase [Acidobacteriota bacterium]
MTRRLAVALVAIVVFIAPQFPSAQGRQGGAPAPAVQSALIDGTLAAPPRRANEGLGPYSSLIIHGVTVIDGTGGPPYGPVDIYIAGNKIQSIRSAGTPGLPMRPAPTAADKVIDATGMYVTPGFIDMHVHGGGAPKNESLEYAYKLWLGHGVTTVRGVPLASHRVSVSEEARSEKDEIVAPHIINYQRPGEGWPNGPVNTPQKARDWVEWGSKNGLDGLKVGAEEPAIMQALMDAAKVHGMGSTAHLQQGGVAQVNAITAARMGLQTVTHFYGHFESILKDYVVQPWPIDMNASDEQWRFGQVARLWDKIYGPGTPEWKAYLSEQLKLGTVFDPTLTIYSAGRDVMRFRAAEWHDKYTLPTLMDFYTPSRSNHGAYWYNWTTEDEVQWRNFYQVWFKLVNEYKKMGGRVTTGSDSGFIYQTYGFGYINELEMLQEAGFHPLEVIQSATYNGAKTLAEAKMGLGDRKFAPIDRGAVKPGLLADLVIIDGNPLENFKILYASGATKLNDKTGQVDHVAGIKYTVKDGIVYDTKQLLADVAKMVTDQKTSRAAKK